MIPYNQINISDTFSNPLYRGFGANSGIHFVVVEKNDDDKMVKVQPVDHKTLEPFGACIWKRHTDRMFSESWRDLNSIRKKK